MPQEPVAIAVFDLNQTVYRKSSKDEFFKYICYKKNYKLLNILQIGLFYAFEKAGLVNQTRFKENFFSYLDGLPPEKVQQYARQFWQVEWEEHFNEQLLKRIHELQEQGVQIIFSTGALDVYVAPLFEHHLPVDAWMATETEYKDDSYQIKGQANKGKEKIRRLDTHFGPKGYRILEAYSDAKEAILREAEKAFLIRDGKPIPFEG